MEPECLAKTSYIISSDFLFSKGNCRSGPRQVWAGPSQRAQEGKARVVFLSGGLVGSPPSGEGKLNGVGLSLSLLTRSP